MRWIAVLASIAMLPACFGSRLVFCENGAICPETLACTEHTPIECGLPDEVAACKAKPERTACTSDATPNGTCISGACTPCTPDYIECRYDAWTPMTSPTTQNLVALWVVADNDAYAAGGGPTVLHYDGTAWSALPPPMSSFGISAVWGSSAGDVVAVAQDGAVFRWVTDSWQSITPSPQFVLFAIWGTRIDELFVAGETGGILRFDGTTWTPMTSNTNRTLYTLSGTSATNLFAGGAAGVIQQYSSSWQPAPGTPLTNVTVRGVWTSGTKLVAVGNEGTMGTMQTYTGSAWNPHPSPAPALFGVWGSADDNVYAVGGGGVIHHEDAAGWIIMQSGTTQALRAVAGATDNVFVVGDMGTILRSSSN